MPHTTHHYTTYRYTIRVVSQLYVAMRSEMWLMVAGVPIDHANTLAEALQSRPAPPVDDSAGAMSVEPPQCRGALELDGLIKHALKALAGCVPSEKELDKQCASVAVVGEGVPLRMLDGDDVQPYLDQIELEGGVPTPEAESKAEGGEPASDPMST